MKPSKKELREQLEEANRKIKTLEENTDSLMERYTVCAAHRDSAKRMAAEAETRASEAEALVAGQRRLLGKADKKLTAVEDRVRELEEAFRDRRDCSKCTHYDNIANKPRSRQFCLTCSRRAKDKFESVCKIAVPEASFT